MILMKENKKWVWFKGKNWDNRKMEKCSFFLEDFGIFSEIRKRKE